MNLKEIIHLIFTLSFGCGGAAIFALFVGILFTVSLKIFSNILEYIF